MWREHTPSTSPQLKIACVFARVVMLWDGRGTGKIRRITDIAKH